MVGYIGWGSILPAEAARAEFPCESWICKSTFEQCDSRLKSWTAISTPIFCSLPTRELWSTTTPMLPISWWWFIEQYCTFRPWALTSDLAINGKIPNNDRMTGRFIVLLKKKNRPSRLKWRANDDQMSWPSWLIYSNTFSNEKFLIMTPLNYSFDEL